MTTPIKRYTWKTPLRSPPDALTLMPHQCEAVKFALERSHSYLGCDAGLGKTIAAARIASELWHLYPTAKFVYVCPPFLMRNTRAEFNKWAPEVCESLKIIPDSLLIRPDTKQKTLDYIKGVPSLIFIDEAHRFKSSDAKRTKALLGGSNNQGLVDYFHRVVFMSGTPIPNRPMELFTILSACAHETIGYMNKFSYGRRFCAGRQNYWGWDFSGASNMKELAERVVGPFMLRQRKALLDLPPKIEEIFYLAGDMSAHLEDFDDLIKRKYDSAEDIIKAQLSTDGKELHIASYRRLLGVEKVPYAIDLIESILEDDESEEGLIVFAYHKEVILHLRDRLIKHAPFVITGDTPMDERQMVVDLFQADPKRRLIIGNYQAMGVGFTLTKATRVLFIEYSWVPGDNSQASDRAHRIGQKDTVLVQYLAFEGSIDQAILEALQRKTKTINKLGEQE